MLARTMTESRFRMLDDGEIVAVSGGVVEDDGEITVTAPKYTIDSGGGSGGFSGWGLGGWGACGNTPANNERDADGTINWTGVAYEAVKGATIGGIGGAIGGAIVGTLVGGAGAGSGAVSGGVGGAAAGAFGYAGEALWDQTMGTRPVGGN